MKLNDITDDPEALASTLGSDAFPGVPPRTTILQACAWTMANHSKAKTAKGLQRFLVNWFTRQQNRGGSPARANEIADGQNYPFGDSLAAKMQRPEGGRR